MTDDTWPWDDDRVDEMASNACADDCALCGGPLTALGTLGALAWFRCRNCGAECSREHAPRVVADASPTDCPF